MTGMPAGSTRSHRIALLALFALILLCLAWELWLAPLRPGGSWLVLKVLPLLWVAPGLIRGRVYQFRISTLLIIAYVVEGCVRAYSDRDAGATLALIEIALATGYFVAAIAFIRGRTSGSRN